MRLFITTLTFAGMFACLHSASAGELLADNGYSIHLASVSGTAYVEKAGANDRFVATLSSGPEATPVRFITNLAAGQSVTISVPRAMNEPAVDVTFTRRGDSVFASDGETVVGSIR